MMMRGLSDHELGSSFSDVWYRVGPTKPALSPHAQITRQSAGSEIGYIVEDPASNQYYRLSEPAYFFAAMLDGERSVQEAWEACNAQLGDAAPTQRECVESLAKLQSFALLKGEEPLAADMIELRRHKAAKARLQRRTGKWFFYSIPLVNPENLLRAMEPMLRAIFSRVGLAVWLAVVGAGLYFVLTNLREIGGAFNSVLAADNLFWLGVVFILIRAWHEFGHAAACKAMGGRCTEIGIILLAGILPIPYCDASSSWRFSERWRRIVVALGGIIFELFAAAIAAVIWAYSEPGLVRNLCYNTMIVSGVATVVFNLNPLLRYDGYYILSDLMGTPNLAQRAKELTQYTLERRAFGVVFAKPPPVRGTGELWALRVFGLLSTPYRILITVTALLLIAGQYLTLGLVLAVAAGAVWLVWPVMKGIGFLATNPKLIGRRARAIGVTAATIGAIAALIGFVPMPAGGYAGGVVEPMDRATIRAGESGYVRSIKVKPGDAVREGQVLFELENPELAAAVKRAQAELDEALSELDRARAESAEEARLAELLVDKNVANLNRARERLDALVIRSPVAGRLLPMRGTSADLAALEGLFASKGEALAQVASTDRMVVRALVSDKDHAYLFRGSEAAAGWPRATVRVRGDAGRELEATIVRAAAAGTRELPAAALATQAGGDVIMDPTDPEQRRTLSTNFLVEVEPSGLPESVRAGVRARVRFGMPPEPLAVQWYRRAAQYFTARLGV